VFRHKPFNADQRRWIHRALRSPMFSATQTSVKEHLIRTTPAAPGHTYVNKPHVRSVTTQE